ncbi:MAG: hypothetical protein JSV88_28720 [Candidatus Aminicenantes bacterium]|nr:MAG: hypothetical protein JSV88_28720 [Candidatus Aminicenantes bacterium]
MANHRDILDRINKLINAFVNDNFTVNFDSSGSLDPPPKKHIRKGDVILYKNANGEIKIGMLAKHKTAVNYDTQTPKITYYVEGAPYDMGFLMGVMAEDEVARMVTEFVDYVVFDFFGIKASPGGLKKIIDHIIRGIINHWIKGMKKDIPVEYQEEMSGILAGCRAANNQTIVTRKKLKVLNFSIDAVLAHVYPGKLYVLGRLWKKWKTPIYCNGISVLGSAVENNNHYMGRDFMFPDAGVYQDTACLIIYNPDKTRGEKPYPIVGQSAPGIVGTMAGLNRMGVGIGVDMSPSGACNAWRPGLNSLLLCRHAVQYGQNADEVVDIIAEAPRGVSWIYITGDPDKGGVIEANCKIHKSENQLIRYLLSFPPKKYKKKGILPDKAYLKQMMAKYNQKERELLRKGLIVRWNNYQYRQEYLKFNKNLWDKYNENFLLLHKVTLYPDAFEKDGFINKYYTEKNCPSCLFFAPERDLPEGVVITTNHCIVPEMRLPAMKSWTRMLSDMQYNDFQWRYDKLNLEIRKVLEPDANNRPTKKIDYQKAKELTDFLSPKRHYAPCYYDKTQRSKDKKEIAITGSISIMDMKKRTMESHFGYYIDKWVKISLLNYL